MVMIVPAAFDDIDELCVLVNAAYRGQGHRPGWTSEVDLIEGTRTSPASLRAMLGKEITILLLRLPDGGKLAGCIAVESHGGPAWHISMLAIDPQEQATGLGRTLLTAAEKYVAARGAALAQMTVIQKRESLIAWYERRGYQRTGATVPFPYEDESVGKPLHADLHFLLLEKALD